MLGRRTPFGNAPKGLDLGCRPPALVRTRSITPMAKPAAAPGAFPVAGPGSPSGTGTTGAMAGRKVGQEKPSPCVRRRQKLGPPWFLSSTSLQRLLQHQCRLLAPLGIGGAAASRFHPTPVGHRPLPVEFSERFDTHRMKGTRCGHSGSIPLWDSRAVRDGSEPEARVLFGDGGVCGRFWWPCRGTLGVIAIAWQT